MLSTRNPNLCRFRVHCTFVLLLYFTNLLRSSKHYFTFCNRLIGKCLIFAEPKTPEVEEAEQIIGIEDENPEALTYESKIRIVLENKTSLEYVVGILGDDIPFTASIEHMFNSTVTSASWLKFKRIGKKICFHR